MKINKTISIFEKLLKIGWGTKLRFWILSLKIFNKIFNCSIKVGYFGPIIFQELVFFGQHKYKFKISWPGNGWNISYFIPNNLDKKLEYYITHDFIELKFSFSEKATKIRAILLMVLTFTKIMSKPLGGWCKFLWPSQKSWTLHTPKKHQMLQSDVGFLDCQKCAGTQPPKATSSDRKKPPWGTFPVFPLPCNTPPIVYVKKKLYLHDIFCRYTIFYTIVVVLAWGGNRDIKRPNSFVTNRPHNRFKAIMKLHLNFHHISQA